MRPLTVTQPYLPPLEEFVPYLERIWDSRILTNGGSVHQELESALCAYLGVEHLSLFANATIALMVATQVLELKGEVVTTPFSFVASANALRWNGLRPVFVDIEDQTLNLDPQQIARAITPQTSAIMAVHCYGNPCDTQAIQAIADRHGLRVLYDAAHAFGVRVGGKSILREGDLSVVSFHATKVFSTVEGGAIISPNAATKVRIDRLRNFGIADELTVDEVGLNGKMSELHAAFGLMQLRSIDAVMARRLELAKAYRMRLASIPGLRCLPDGTQDLPNGTYFPIRVEAAFPLTRDALYERMKRDGIMARRYFFPLISDLAAYRQDVAAGSKDCPVADRAAREILCLPIYPAMTDTDLERVVDALEAIRHSF